MNTSAAEQELDLFGTPGHRIWVEVSDGQLALMNTAGGGGFPGPVLLEHAGRTPLLPAYDLKEAIPVDGEDGDIYTPGNLEDLATYADHVVVEDAATRKVADYGKLEVELVGESTFRAWGRRQIPNLHVDTDEFQAGVRLGGFEHVRLNNSLVGSIFREHVAHRIYRALGYPALRTSFVFLGSNVWGEGVWVPMTLVEVYKKKFCTDNEVLLGGTCENMWEFAGDVGAGGLPPNACQVHTCNDARLATLEAALLDANLGPGFRDALASFIDWDRFHEFQCIGWILSTGDDAVHSMNNNLVIERSDGRLVFAPYSVDISAGQDWYPATPLLGQSTLSRGCQADPVCWAETVATCETLVSRFDALNPETLVDETQRLLDGLDMMRAGDDARAVQLREWLSSRQRTLAPELELFRYLPDEAGVCPNGLVACNDHGCGTEEDCATRPCEPGMVWCDVTQTCVGLNDPCATCAGETPLYCPASYECVTGTKECSRDCHTFVGPDTEYCPATRACEPVGVCPTEPPDGGAPPDSGAPGGDSDGGLPDAGAGFGL